LSGVNNLQYNPTLRANILMLLYIIRFYDKNIMSCTRRNLS